MCYLVNLLSTQQGEDPSIVGQERSAQFKEVRALRWNCSMSKSDSRRKRAVRDCHLVIYKSSAVSARVDRYAKESCLLSGGVQESLDLKCAHNGRKFREGQGERELLPSARCEHIVCSCQQIGATWPSTCLGMRMQATTDSLQHTREVNRSSHAYSIVTELC